MCRSILGLFPGMPYPNLGKAHYRLSLRKSLWHGLSQLWKETTAAQTAKQAVGRTSKAS